MPNGVLNKALTMVQVAQDFYLNVVFSEKM